MEQPDISTPKGRRDLAMILLLYDSAARVQELCDLRICDIRIDSLPVVHLLGKGRKVEMFRLPNRVHRYCANTFVRTILIYQNAAMTSCLQIRKGKVDSQRCFLRASKIYPQSKYCGGFIFPQITPHCLRHSKAMHLVEAGKISFIFVTFRARIY